MAEVGRWKTASGASGRLDGRGSEAVRQWSRSRPPQREVCRQLARGRRTGRVQLRRLERRGTTSDEGKGVKSQAELLTALQVAAKARVDMRNVMHLVEIAYDGTFRDWIFRGSPSVPLFVPNEKRT